MSLEISWICVFECEDTLSFCFFFKVMYSGDRLIVNVVYSYSVVYVYMNVLKRFEFMMLYISHDVLS